MAKILGLDLGSYSVKNNEDLIFKSVYEVVRDTDSQTNYDKVQYQGISYYIEKGKFDADPNKTDKKDTMPLFLYALGRSLQPHEKSVKIVMGLPVDEAKIKANKNTIREKFTGRFEFELTIKGRTEKRFVEVEDVMVFPECVGAYYTITKNLSKKDVILIDIGGSTINLAYFESGRYVKSNSLHYGTLKVYGAIAEESRVVNDNSHFSIEEIIKYMDRGEIYWKGKYDKMDYVPRVVSKYVDDLIQDMKNLEYPFNSSEIILSGGGVSLLGEEVTSRFSTSVEMTSDYLHANASGFKKVGVNTWQRQ